MTRDPLKTTISRIAAIRARSAYRQEKLRLLAELRDARKRGEDPNEFLAALERSAIAAELLLR